MVLSPVRFDQEAQAAFWLFSPVPLSVSLITSNGRNCVSRNLIPFLVISLAFSKGPTGTRIIRPSTVECLHNVVGGEMSSEQSIALEWSDPCVTITKWIPSISYKCFTMYWVFDWQVYCIHFFPIGVPEKVGQNRLNKGMYRRVRQYHSQAVNQTERIDISSSTQATFNPVGLLLKRLPIISGKPRHSG